MTDTKDKNNVPIMFVKNKESERNSATTATTYAEKTIDLFEF